MKQIYFKITNWLNIKKVGLFFVFLFALSMIPIYYVGFYNHATGDDFWYGAYTYHAWMETHSLIEVMKGAAYTVKEIYYTWQGTWFTIFLFTLSPEIFSPQAYVIEVFISTALLITAVSYLVYDLLVKVLKVEKGTFFAIDSILLFLMFQYMPRTTSGIYWFNGVMHYSVPLLLATVAIVHMRRYFVSKGKYNFWVTTLCMTALGGCSYLAALLALLVLVLFAIMAFLPMFPVPRNKRNWFMMIPIVCEMIGLVISAKSPGNAIRSEEFEISLKWALQTVYYAVDRGIYLTRDDYLAKIPGMLLLLIVIGIISWVVLWKRDFAFSFPLPVLFVLYMCGIYWAMYTPGIFSKSDVSGGVPNTIQQVFLLTSVANIIYSIGWIQYILKKHLKKDSKVCVFLDSPKCYGVVILPVILVCLIGTGIWMKQSEVLSTNQYCLKTITDGSLYEFDRCIKEQQKIYLDRSIEDAVITEMEAPYPLKHFTVDKNKDSEYNMQVEKYYQKKSVVCK